jgi:hypothetical protein
MSLRHKKQVGSLETGLAADWNDNHITDFTDETEDNLMRIGSAISGEWDTAQTAGGSAPVWALVGAAGSGHAWVTLNTGAATGQSSSMRLKMGGSAGDTTSPDDLPIFSAAVNVEAVHTAGIVAEWGFFGSATAIFTANQAGAYFRIEDNQLYAVCGDGAAEDAELIGDFNEYGNYKIVINSANVAFYVDNMKTAVVTIAANRPAVNLTPKISVISANNVDSTLNVDGVALVRLRKK